MSVRSWRWTSFRLPLNPHIGASVLLKRENLNLSFVFMYVMTDEYSSLRFFSCFFYQSFVYSVAFWCHPSSCCEDKGIEWRLLYVNHFLVVFILLLFMLLVDLCQGLPRIGLWGRMCDLYVKESFLTAILQSSRRDIQPCIVSSVDSFFDSHCLWLSIYVSYVHFSKLLWWPTLEIMQLHLVKF